MPLDEQRMPSREVDLVQLIRERGHPAGLDALEQSRPGQSLVEVASEPTYEPVVDVITIQVPESARPWPAVRPGGIERFARNQVRVKYCRVNEHPDTPIQAGPSPHRLPKVSGAAMHMPHLPLCHRCHRGILKFHTGHAKQPISKIPATVRRFALFG